jgi:hypothetical protein
MPAADTLRRHLADLVVVFVGVVLAFAVENLREDLNERAVGEQYLHGFREDLLADLSMLQAQQEIRRSRLECPIRAWVLRRPARRSTAIFRGVPFGVGE